MSNRKDFLEAELETKIGDLGGEETQSLGKLKHKAAYGEKEDLNSEDRASLNDFLNSSLST